MMMSVKNMVLKGSKAIYAERMGEYIVIYHYVAGMLNSFTEYTTRAK